MAKKKKLRKVKGKTSGRDVMPEEVYKPTLCFDNKQLSGLKGGQIGQKLNIAVNGRLKRIAQEDYNGKKTISYSMEIDKMSLPALEKKSSSGKAIID